MQTSVQHSVTISRAVGSKLDCIKQIKDLAVFHTMGKFAKQNLTLDACIAKGFLTVPLFYACYKVDRINHTLMFAGMEEEIEQKILAFIPKEVKTVPTPASVIAKMVAARLHKVEEGVRSFNSWVIMNNENVAKIGQGAVLVALPNIEFSDMAGGFLRYNTTNNWHVKRPVEDIRNTLARPECTEEAAKKGWELFGVKKVMAE